MVEGIYAASGAVPTPPPTPVPGTEPINYSLVFEGQNCGGHSEIRFKAFDLSHKTNRGLKLTIQFNSGNYANTLDAIESLNYNFPTSYTQMGNTLTFSVDWSEEDNRSTVEIAFWAIFKHTYTNTVHPDSSNRGSYDGCTNEVHDGGPQMVRNTPVANHATVSLEVIQR